MKMHITNLYDAVEIGTAIIAQHNVVEIAKGIGFTEMALQSCQAGCDTENELRKRMHGITAAVEDGDIIVFQSPTWQVASLLYDKTLLKTIRFHLNVKIAIFIHDVMPFMFGKTEDAWKKTIEIYNMADLVIVPSEAMLEILCKKGLKVKKTLIQTMWDLPFSGELRKPGFQRQIFFSGSADRFKFVKSWNYDVPMILFHKEFTHNKQNICFGGWKNTTELLVEYSHGGFGLIWEQTDYFDYYKYNQPYKLSSYLAAGIPVIIQKGLQHEHIIKNQGWGFAVDSLEAAVQIVKETTEEEYYRMVNNIEGVSFLVRNGFFTKELLIQTVNTLLMDTSGNSVVPEKISYSFLKENSHGLEALICTNSDQIEHCEDLIQALPQMHFHIAAFTGMSSKLMDMKLYNNVSLYPGISFDDLNRLFDRCDYYFDINHQAEIASAVYRAFLHNQLIFAFDKTVHNRKYVANEHIYLTDDFEQMASCVRAVMEDVNLLEQHLAKQRNFI